MDSISVLLRASLALILSVAEHGLVRALDTEVSLWADGAKL